MADQLTVMVQFSEDAMLYYVPSMAFKHAWLSVERYEDRSDAPGWVMPFSGLCRCASGGAARKVYYRRFLHQSYFSVRLGTSAERAIDDPLVIDYRDAKAEIPAAAAQTQSRARRERK